MNNENKLLTYANQTLHQLQAEISSLIDEYGSDSLLLPVNIESHLASWYKNSTNNLHQIQTSLGISKEDALILLKRIHNTMYSNIFDDTEGLIKE